MTDVPLHAYPDPQLVDNAVRAAAAAAEPRKVGDFGLSILVPNGYQTLDIDVRQFELHPRERAGTFAFVDTGSFARYVNRYRDDASTLVYAIDVGADPAGLLDRGHTAFVAVIDDYPVNATSARSHRALLELKPTVAARRWGQVLTGRAIDQEQLLDLVVEGAAEIVEPDAAVLRDLASNLHAIRSVEVESVIRTGGEGTIAVAENVKLRAGTARTVTFPEDLSVAFSPFMRADDVVEFDIRVKAGVRDKHVMFALTAPGLAAELLDVIDSLAIDVRAATDVEPLWRPNLVGI